MKKNLFALLLLSTLCACGDTDKDETAPIISADGIVANPIDCQVYNRGDVIPFTYVFTDDRELGKFNIEVHPNFNHHTHSTTSVDCELDDKKEEVHAWVFNQDYDIPSGLRTYTPRVDIPIPADVDPGDYHFMVRLTDRVGWQQLHAVAIKIK